MILPASTLYLPTSSVEVVDGESAKCVNVGYLNWAQANNYLLDLTTSLQLLEFRNLQALYCDNSQSNAPTQITMSGTGQVIIVPPNSQGWFSILATDRTSLTFANSGGAGATGIWLSNQPVAAMHWQVSGSGGGATMSGGVQRPTMVANLVAAGQFGSSVNNNITGVTGAPGYYVTSINVTLQPQAAVGASPATFEVTISDNGTGSQKLFYADWLLPATGTSQQQPAFQTPAGFFWNNKQAGSALILTISTGTALTGNYGRYVVNYGLCSFVG